MIERLNYTHATQECFHDQQDCQCGRSCDYGVYGNDTPLRQGELACDPQSVIPHQPML